MKLRVQKYGGSSLATTEQIREVAKDIAQNAKQGESFVIVVSAMGNTTDDLCTLSQKISLTPSRRELDMLLSTGERISMALMSMAINDLGIPAISFTGSQAGILTDESHNNARILSVTPMRIEEEFKRNQVVVLAGFQGVNPKTKEITTLGRGGSDLTAVAMAHHFKASACEIMKDVDGVYSADPRLFPHAVHREHLHFEHLLELTFWGSPVLHYRSVELAQRLNIPILIQLAPGHKKAGPAQLNATLIDGDTMIFEQPGLVSVNSHSQVVTLIANAKDWFTTLNHLEALLNKNRLPWPQLLDTESSRNGLVIYLTAPDEQLVSLAQVTKESNGELALCNGDLASVTATAFGVVGSDLARSLVQILADAKIAVKKMSFSSRSFTVFVDRIELEKTLQIWHSQMN